MAWVESLRAVAVSPSAVELQWALPAEAVGGTRRIRFRLFRRRQVSTAYWAMQEGDPANEKKGVREEQAHLSAGGIVVRQSGATERNECARRFLPPLTNLAFLKSNGALPPKQAILHHETVLAR